MTKICYDKNLLQEVCNRDKCIIDFDKIEKYNREIKVEFRCNCGVEYNKTFRQIYDVSGGYCKICTKKKAKDKSKQTCIERYGVENTLINLDNTRYTKELLENICSRDKCIIDFDKIDKYNREINIDFICNCGLTYSKTFRQLYEVGAFCKICTKNKGNEKSKQTSIERYDVEHASQSQNAKDKSKQTCIERYGIENPSQSQEVKDKKKETCFNNYGVEYSLQSQEVRDKSKQTNLLNFGFEHPMQNAEFSEKVSKNAYNLKEFNFPCGTTIQVQGYELFLLKNLVEEGYRYKDIIVKRTEVPEIWYEKDNKKHRYYCDIYIPKINTIYEVKSTWTYKKDIEKINLTKQACIDAGYLFELYVYNSKGVKQEI